MIDHGDRVIHNGDLVAFIHKEGAPLIPAGSQMIKIVRGKGGDVIDIQPHRVQINEQILEQSMEYGLKTLSAKAEDYARIMVVPEGELFLMGTTLFSNDSRFWGSIPESDVVGKVYALF